MINGVIHSENHFSDNSKRVLIQEGLALFFVELLVLKGEFSLIRLKT
jgi:hypothetical protein